MYFLHRKQLKNPTSFGCIWKENNLPFFVLLLLNAANLIFYFNFVVTIYSGMVLLSLILLKTLCQQTTAY